MAPAPATNVTVQDTLPAGVTYVSSTPVGSYDPVSGVWTVGTVNVGAPQTLAIDATVTSAMPPPVNTASISGADQFDPNTANNSDTASLNPQEADLLKVGKIVSDPTPNVGDVITFPVTLTNTGPASATNVSMTDLLPAGLTFVAGGVPSQGTYVPATGIWTVGNLANGHTPRRRCRSRRARGQLYRQNQHRRPSVMPTSSTPTPATIRTALHQQRPQHADLARLLEVDRTTPEPNVGDIVTFTIGLHNAGPDAATNVVVNDLLPAGLSLQTSTPSQGTYAGGVWTVGTVTLGDSQTLIITALVVSPNAQTNTASIGHSDQFDPVTGNNSASSLPRRPSVPILAITKTVSPHRTAPGMWATRSTYELSRSPTRGRTPATNISVSDLLPTAGLYFCLRHPQPGVLRQRQLSEDHCQPCQWGAGDAYSERCRRRPHRANQHGHHHRRRPVRSQYREQHRRRHYYPAAGRPVRGQDRQQSNAQRRGHCHLHH